MTRIYSGETDGDLEWIKKFTMDREQKVNDGRLEADHRRLDYRNFTDDEEVMLLPHKGTRMSRTIRFRRSVMGFEWDSIDDDSLAEAADADGLNMDEFYQ